MGGILGLCDRLTYCELGEDANNIIRSKARRLIGTAGYISADCQDIEQDLALDLHMRLKHYDPIKSKINTFMSRMVDHCIASLIEKRNAACRDWRLSGESLDAPEWQEAEGGESPIERLPDPTATTSDNIALRMDLQAALKTLPDDLRELLSLLLLDSNISRVAREIGIPRTTLYYHLERLRKALREAGLEEYFPSSRQFSDLSGM